MRCFYLLYCLWVICCGFTEENTKDLLYKIREIKYRDPQMALVLLDSLRKMEESSHFQQVPEFRIDIAQGQIYQIMRLDQLAVRFWEKALQADSVRVRDAYFFTVLNGIVNVYYRMADYENALEYCLLLLERGEKSGDEWSIGDCYFMIGQIEWQIGRKEQAYRDFKKALNILENGKNPGTKKLLSYVYGEIMTMADADGRFSYALEIGTLREKLLREMEELGGQEGYIDQQRGYLYAKLAYLYQKEGKCRLAGSYFEKFEKTHFATTLEGREYGFPYLKNAGQYEKALCFLRDMRREYEVMKKDTIDINMRVCYENLSEIYADLGQCRKAYHFLKRALVLADSLQERQQRSRITEMSVLYSVKEKEKRIQEQEGIIKKKQTFIGRLFGFVSVGIIMLIGVGIYANRMKNKNRILVGKIEEGIHYRQMLRRIGMLYKGEHKIQVNCKERELFENLDRLVVMERLFLRPNLTRDEMVSRFCTNKNQLANAIRFCTGQNFTEYINSLRLECALKILTEGNEKIEVVAERSGFGSARSFYRIFKDYFGLSPAEYRHFCSK